MMRKKLMTGYFFVDWIGYLSRYLTGYRSDNAEPNATLQLSAKYSSIISLNRKIPETLFLIIFASLLCPFHVFFFF